MPSEASSPNPLDDALCVVTGAGGFIGSHLVEALLDRGARVRALVHYNSRGDVGFLGETRRTHPRRGRLEIVAGDVRDGRCARGLVEGARAVFHLAALITIPFSYVAPESYIDTNVKGTLNILEACRDRGVERILHTSTSETYGTARRVPMDEGHPLRAQSPYSASKIAADKLAESYHLSFNLPVTTVRPFNTFGPRQSLRGVVPTIMAQALSRRCEAISLGSVEPVRDFTFVGDTARAFCMIAEAPLERVAGRLYNLGTGEGVSVGRLVEMIQALTGTHKPVIQTEERKRPDKSEVLELISDPGRVLREVGWRAETALKEGLRRTLPWVEAKLADSDDVLRHMI